MYFIHCSIRAIIASMFIKLFLRSSLQLNAAIFVVTSCLLPLPALAQPYGVGLYNANVPYGGQTSLTIATNGNITIPITPSDNGTLGTGTSTVTVTSADATGFKLYIRAVTATNLSQSADTIPASANGSPAALAVNTWGYNTDASANFVGISLTDGLIRNATGPYTAGDITTVTYGVNIDNSKASGSYSRTIMYTAVPQTN